MSSKLRPELGSGDGTTPCVNDGTAYVMIYNAVEVQAGLVHGKLHAHGAHCAIGSFFTVNKNVTLPWSIVNEIAAVNDSMPTTTERQRKIRVARWLRWKLASLGMPGFVAKSNSRKK